MSETPEKKFYIREDDCYQGSLYLRTDDAWDGFLTLVFEAYQGGLSEMAINVSEIPLLIRHLQAYAWFVQTERDGVMLPEVEEGE